MQYNTRTNPDNPIGKENFAAKLAEDNLYFTNQVSLSQASRLLGFILSAEMLFLMKACDLL